MPKRGNVFFIRLMLPPYICDDATMWSPWLRIAVIAQNVAAMPDDGANGGGTTFERRDTLFEDADGRVGDAAE